MHDDSPTIQPPPTVVANGGASVTDLATRRRSSDVLRSITFVFGGVNYGTLAVSTPYTHGKPIALYLVPQVDGAGGEIAGPLDCLVTDELDLATELNIAR
jgi:hypothetical protein